MKEDEILEEFAELEHEQWTAWSKNIVKTESISYERLERWQKLWIPYKQRAKRPR